jgi:polysaccharide chain length determinant protein (PEP-CTERM system associated)
MHSNEEAPAGISQTIDRAIRILVRGRWLIAATAFVVTIGTILVLLYLPNRYMSEATIFVTHQKVPERYVVSTMTADISQTLDAMSQEVLSRPRLLAMIDELGLYPDKRNHLAPEKLMEVARRDVSIEPLRDRLNAFKISFVAGNPQLAHAVTSRLTALFIEYNLKTRSDQATTTTEFLREQLELAKQKLTDQEKQLRDFKMQHLGELPEQQQGNVAILAGLETQLDNIMATRNQAQQQRLYLESMLRGYRRSGQLPVATAAIPARPVSPQEAARRELARLQLERKRLLAVYTALHPEVEKIEAKLKAQETFVNRLRGDGDVERSRSTEPAADAQSDSGLLSDTALDAEDDIGVAQLKSQLRANDLELQNSAKKEQRLRSEIEQYRQRLNLTPVREQQLTSMQRDYDLIRQHYGDLLKKEQESQLATNLERRQEGQQFRLADPPTMPTLPSSPKRVKISLAALAAGLLLGCALAVLKEMRDSSLQTESDASSRLALPVLVGIPLFLTPAEQRLRSRRRVVEAMVGASLLIVIAFAELYVYRHG